MIRDRFYNQIIAGLNAGLDPDAFERCAADLLRQMFPTLVPIPGGRDSGMDGAIADAEGEPFPLVSTTSEDVIGNLSRNLASYLKHGGTRRKAVLATSRSLTPKQRSNLYERARDLGFTLIQVYEQGAMADLLYRSPRWCRDLLCLVGSPPALSLVPRTSRPLLTHTLVGRNGDLAWLADAAGDRLLVGQPGSGKTFLLRQLARRGRALFVVTRSMSDIAASLRESAPEALIVDDAQLDCELVLDLKRMREECGVDFAIVATCWPGDTDVVAEALNLAEPQVRRLDLLTRDEIVEVVKAAGIQGPTDLVREIVNQAEGRPGLAVTLAHLCLHGGVRELASGEALRRSILRPLKSIAGENAEAILAGFAVGGDTGMAINAVAKGLGLTALAVRSAVVNLAHGGIIRDVDRIRRGGVVRHGPTGLLSVRPAELRFVLLRDVFFSGATSLSIEPLLEAAPAPRDAAVTLTGAKSRGVPIPHGLLKMAVEAAPSAEAYEAYAWLGRGEATWVLQNHAEALLAVARPALHHAPEAAIPLLLQAAVGDERELHPNPEHPLRLVQDWVAAGRPGTDQAVARRRALVDAVRDWLSHGGDARVALRALRVALSPGFWDIGTDPGMGRTVTITHGLIGLDDMRAVQSLWAEVVSTLRGVAIDDWRPILEAIEDWAYPGRVDAEVPGEMTQAMRSLAAQMIRDLVSLAEQHPGVLQRAQQVSAQLHADIEIAVDAAFETLYPPRSTRRDPICQAEWASAIRRLANTWRAHQPGDVAERIAFIEREARLADARGVWGVSLLAQDLAEHAEQRRSWIESALEAGCSGHFVGPFLEKAASTGEEGWQGLAVRCLGDPDLEGCVISIVLGHACPPRDLLTEVLGKIEGWDRLVETCCLRGEVAEQVVGTLLDHNDPLIAAAAAQGEWYAEPKGSVRESLRQQWRAAFLRTIQDEHWLGEVFAASADLAAEWLRARFEDPTALIRLERAVTAAAAGLGVETRRALLREVPPTGMCDYLIASLVGESPDLYREVLADDRLRPLHLAPLSGDPEGRWIDKAKLALDAGYSPEAIALAAMRPPAREAWSDEVAMWTGWGEKFERLSGHEDERLRRIAHAGAAFARGQRDQASKHERDEAVYGIR